MATTFSVRGCSLWFQPVSMHFCALGVGAAQHAPALHAGAGEESGIALVVVIAAGHVIQRARRASEFAHATTSVSSSSVFDGSVFERMVARSSSRLEKAGSNSPHSL